MRYLVTGGAGFIGSNTVDELVRRGHSVVVLDDLSGGKEENLAEIRNKITFIKGTIIDIEIIRRAIYEADYVIHLAARTSVPFSMKDPVETNRINIDGTLNVLVAARDAKVKRVSSPLLLPHMAKPPRCPRRKTCSRSLFLLMVSRNMSASFTPRLSAAATASKMFACATSIFLVRARTPARPIQEYWQNSAPHSWKKPSLSFLATARSPAISPTLTTLCKPTCLPVKLPALPEESSTSAQERAST